MATPTARIVQLLAALLLAAALAAIALTAGIPVTTDVTAVALRLLAALLVTTLVFERGLEVVVQLLRQREATDLEHRLEDAREAMRSHRADEALEADPGARAAREAKRVARVSEATRAWRDHRDGTRLRTLSFAFAGGLVLAALGFRFFEFRPARARTARSVRRVGEERPIERVAYDAW